MQTEAPELSGEWFENYVREVVVPGARENFNNYGEVRPIWFMLVQCDDNGKPMDCPHIAMMLGGDPDKDREVARVAQVCKVTKAVGIVHVCEAWMTQVSLLTDPRSVKPSAARNREEVVIVTSEHVSGKATTSKAVIDPKTRKLGDWESMPGGKGRMFGLLSEPIKN